MLNRRDFIRRLVGGGVGIALAPSLLLEANPYDVDIAMTFAPHYDDVWFANEALEALSRAFRSSNFAFRRIEDRWPIGDTITIRLPERFR